MDLATVGLVVLCRTRVALGVRASELATKVADGITSRQTSHSQLVVASCRRYLSRCCIAKALSLQFRY